MLLPKQQAQAEAWRLFIVSGSLTWLRRPRLASFTSTTHVETNHPLVHAQPNWLHCKCTVHFKRPLGHLNTGDGDLAVFFNASSSPGHVAFCIAFFQGFSAVLLLATASESKFHFRATFFEVQL